MCITDSSFLKPYRQLRSGSRIPNKQTSGFWDYTKFSNEENIVFIDENTTKDWVNKIDYLISNQNLRKNISESAFKTIEKDYTLEKFYSSFKEIVF